MTTAFIFFSESFKYSINKKKINSMQKKVFPHCLFSVIEKFWSIGRDSFFIIYIMYYQLRVYYIIILLSKYY